MNIINVGYDSTNYYVIAETKPKLSESQISRETVGLSPLSERRTVPIRDSLKLLIDVGWSGTLPKLQHQCKRMGVALPDIQHLLITHYHPDHAGLTQELKRIGLKLILLENQLSAVPVLRTYMKPEHNYVDIDLSDNIDLKIEDSRAFLEKLGIQGEIIATPGHSEDSVTLILDEGAAFTGDLPHPMMLTEDSTEARESWNKIRALGVKMVYPGHGPVWRLDR